ncbi:hypothetical protein D3C73_1222080 [compost metagenome]
MFSVAVIGTPAVTLPISGTLVTEVEKCPEESSAPKISIALGLVGSRRMRPFFSSRSKCPCTVELEAKPTASPISLTEGG